MRVIAPDVLCLFLILWNGSTCTEIKTNSSNYAISMTCNVNQQIVIHSINTTSKLVPRLLEQCSARGKCDVPNHDREAVQLTYWCRIEFPIIEMKTSSVKEDNSNTTVIGLMSEKYDQGKYQRAENIHCDLRFLKQGYKNQLTFNIHELAPYTNSSEYCLWVGSYQNPIFCSGSKRIQTTYTFFDGGNSWQFKLTMASTAKNVPLVRYWIDIDVGNQSARRYLVKCSSSPVPGSTHRPENAVATLTKSVSMMGTALMLISLVLIMVTLLMCRKSSEGRKDPEDERDCSSIDKGSIVANREEEVAQSNGRNTEETVLATTSQNVEDPSPKKSEMKVDAHTSSTKRVKNNQKQLISEINAVLRASTTSDIYDTPDISDEEDD